MHATRLLHKQIAKVCQTIHSVRLQALFVGVETVCEGAPLTVTGLGRWLRCKAKVKHAIKRMDRLLSNGHLHAERFEVYVAQALLLLCGNTRPVVLVDWSDLSYDRKSQLLRASIPVGGRALTLYEEVHPLSRLGSRAVHRSFLERLAALLPSGCCPIVVTDAGFTVPWFRLVLARGWDFVGRVKNRTYLLKDGDAWWWRAEALHTGAGKRPECLGRYTLAMSNPLPVSLYRHGQPPKGRVKRNLDGSKSRSKHSLKKAKGHREPWLVATSLPAETQLARVVVNLFAKRMQIEEAFRDLKSRRFGLGFEHGRTTDPDRLGVLTLIATLATFALWLIGQATKRDGVHRHYQANTVRDREVLSNIFLGIQVLRRRDDRPPAGAIKRALDDLHQRVYAGAST
jgi:hypothetical protein